ncbi:MAG: hypothetical protein QW184_00725 [Nanopusillaceae archaeon]
MNLFQLITIIFFAVLLILLFKPSNNNSTNLKINITENEFYNIISTFNLSIKDDYNCVDYSNQLIMHSINNNIFSCITIIYLTSNNITEDAAHSIVAFIVNNNLTFIEPQLINKLDYYPIISKEELYSSINKSICNINLYKDFFNCSYIITRIKTCFDFFKNSSRLQQNKKEKENVLLHNS